MAVDNYSWKLLACKRDGKKVTAPPAAIVGGWSSDKTSKESQKEILPIYVARVRHAGVWHVASLHSKGTALGLGPVTYFFSHGGKCKTSKIGQVLVADTDQVGIPLEIKLILQRLSQACYQLTYHTAVSVLLHSLMVLGGSS